MSVNFSIFGIPGTHIEYGAIDQMNKAMALPMAKSGALMPDAHVGYGMPIGGVVNLYNAISPGFVGYDIACRVSVTILDITPQDFMNRRADLARDMRTVSSFGIGSGFEDGKRKDHQVMDDPLWKEKPLKELHQLAHQQLGSSGGGNHFFDALIGHSLTECDFPTVDGKFVAIMTHSGSRGTGHKLATYFINLAEQETKTSGVRFERGYEWLELDGQAGQDYLRAMNLMGRYAQANHHLIHSKFLKITGLKEVAFYENHHNFAWTCDNGDVIHRKGATPAALNQIGIIPGSSGTESYLVKGLGNKLALESSSHGAGRPFSRSEAKRRYDKNLVESVMVEKDVLSFGVDKDEAFTAYKDINVVMELQKDLVIPFAKMFPKIVIMGGRADDGD